MQRTAGSHSNRQSDEWSAKSGGVAEVSRGGYGIEREKGIEEEEEKEEEAEAEAVAVAEEGNGGHGVFIWCFWCCCSDGGSSGGLVALWLWWCDGQVEITLFPARSIVHNSGQR